MARQATTRTAEGPALTFGRTQGGEVSGPPRVQMSSAGRFISKEERRIEDINSDVAKLNSDVETFNVKSEALLSSLDAFNKQVKVATARGTLTQQQQNAFQSIKNQLNSRIGKLETTQKDLTLKAKLLNADIDKFSVQFGTQPNELRTPEKPKGVLGKVKAVISGVEQKLQTTIAREGGTTRDFATPSGALARGGVVLTSGAREIVEGVEVGSELIGKIPTTKKEIEAAIKKAEEQARKAGETIKTTFMEGVSPTATIAAISGFGSKALNKVGSGFNVGEPEQFAGRALATALVFKGTSKLFRGTARVASKAVKVERGAATAVIPRTFTSIASKAKILREFDDRLKLLGKDIGKVKGRAVGTTQKFSVRPEKGAISIVQKKSLKILGKTIKTRVEVTPVKITSRGRITSIGGRTQLRATTKSQRIKLTGKKAPKPIRKFRPQKRVEKLVGDVKAVSDTKFKVKSISTGIRAGKPLKGITKTTTTLTKKAPKSFLLDRKRRLAFIKGIKPNQESIFSFVADSRPVRAALSRGKIQLVRQVLKTGKGRILRGRLKVIGKKIQDLKAQRPTSVDLKTRTKQLKQITTQKQQLEQAKAAASAEIIRIANKIAASVKPSIRTLNIKPAKGIPSLSILKGKTKPTRGVVATTQTKDVTISLGARPIQKGSTKTRTKGITKIKQKQDISAKTKQRISTSTAQKLNIKQRQRITQRVAQRQRLRQRQQLKQRQALRTVQTVAISTPSVRVPSTKIPIIPIPIVPPFPSGRKPKKPKRRKAYNVFGKALKTGKQLKINRVPLAKSKAKSLGAYAVDTSLSATFKIKPTGGKPSKTKMNFPSQHFKKTKAKYRTYKIVKGKRVPLKNKYIEKRKRRLDTIQEVRKIQLAKRIAQLRKKPKKRVRRKKK